MKIRIARWLLVIGFLLYMFLPLYASARFSVGPEFTLKHYTKVLVDRLFWSSLWRSVIIACGVAVVSLVMIILAIYWTTIRWPGARRILDVLVLLPFVIPGVILALGLIRVFSHSPIPAFKPGKPVLLVFATSVLILPYAYRSVDNAFRAIDAGVLCEAAASLGASPMVALWRVILPNVFPGILAGGLLVFSAVWGEFTLANHLVGQAFMTYPVYVRWAGTQNARAGSSLAIISFFFTVLMSLAVIWVSRRWSQLGDQAGAAGV